MVKRINLNVLVVVSALAVCVMGSKPVLAAPGPAIPILGGPGAISAGVFLPQSGSAKDNGGSTQFALDFHYTLPVPNPLSIPLRTMASIGVETGAKGGKHSTIIPLTISELISPEGGSPVSGGSPYFGIGIGAYIMNTSFNVGTKIGGFGEVGYNLTSMAFINAKYQFVQDANGLVVSAGLR